MTKAFFMSLILLCALLLAAPAFAMENEPQDFRGIPWGAAPPGEDNPDSEKLGLKMIDRYDSIALYRRDESVSVAGVKTLSSVDYYFHDRSGFICAEMQFRGIKNYELILKECIDQWGQPVQGKSNNAQGEVVEWNLWPGQRITAFLAYFHQHSEISLLKLSHNDYL